MNELILSSSTVGVVISFMAYGIGVLLKKRFKSSLCNPLLIAIILIIALLLALHIDYDSYYASARYINYFLTPATVSLAIPLYLQLDKLKKNMKAILISLVAGVLTSLVSIWLMSLLFGLSHQEYVTLLPKSITTAIGIGVSEELGGYVSITASIIIVTGIMGNACGDLICRLFRITDPIAKGLGMGCAAHAVGTARALEWGELEGAMSSLALVITGLLTVIGASVFATFL